MVLKYTRLLAWDAGFGLWIGVFFGVLVRSGIVYAKF